VGIRCKNVAQFFKSVTSINKHRNAVVSSTGCQFHSASRTSPVYSFFYHLTELLLSTCTIAASGLISPRPGYTYDHLRGPISGCGGCGHTLVIMLSLPLVLHGKVSLLLFTWLTQWTHFKRSWKLTCSLKLTLFSCLRGAPVAVRPRYSSAAPCNLPLLLLLLMINSVKQEPPVVENL